MSSASAVEATTIVPHGSYERPSRFQITQHSYAAGMSAYIELLEIADPPDGRCGLVIHEYIASGSEAGSWFMEWEDLASAKAAFEQGWGAPGRVKRLLEQPDFKRHVHRRKRTPWFYAVSDQELDGDFVK